MEQHNTFLLLLAICLLLTGVALSSFNKTAYAARLYADEADAEIRPLTLNELSAAIDLRTRYDESKNEGYQQKDLRFEERLNVTTRGSVYHPYFLGFDVYASLGPGQHFMQGDATGNTEMFVYDYNASLNFFRQKPYRFTLFTNRSTDVVPRPLFAAVDMVHDASGGVYNYQGTYPIKLLLMQNHTNENSTDLRRDRREKTAGLSMANSGEGPLKNEFRYIYKDTSEVASAGTLEVQQITENDISMTSRIDSGMIHGNSVVGYLSNTGTLKTDQFRINESFYADHSSTLTSLYNYNLSRYSTPGFSSLINQGGIGLRHKLYESLQTTVQADAGKTEATDYTETFMGPNFSLSYLKKVPGGVFSMGYNFLFRRTDLETDQGTVSVYGERIVLLDARITYLSHPNVIQSSVVVRDTVGALLTLNVDYELTVSGALTQIKRVGLPDGTVVLVDYRYSAPTSLKYDTVTNGLFLRYTLQDSLSLYFTYLNTRQKELLLANIPPDQNPLYNINKKLIGADWRWRQFGLGAEYEDDSSDLSPFTAWRFRGTLDLVLTEYALLGLNANHFQTEYKKEPTKQRVENVGLLLRLRPSLPLEVTLDAGYLRETGTAMNTRAWRFRLDALSRFRAVEMKLWVEYLSRTDRGAGQYEFRSRFDIVRRFDVL
jgi:hypothetical protein